MSVKHRITRSSGVLMPIFSLPSPHGIGTLGKSAFDFVDFLKQSGQTYWQILPLGHTGYGSSPYQTFSVVAGNPNFIDLDLLVEQKLISKASLVKADLQLSSMNERVDYSILEPIRKTLLLEAFHTAPADLLEKAEQFKEKNADWLPDYALFMALKDSFSGKPLWEWPSNRLKSRDAEVINHFKKLLHKEINFYIFLQYLFFTQWTALKKYANKNGIFFIGDIPIYPSLDSVDVWTNPQLFKLNRNLTAKGIAGVPPDCYSETGQLWGNPVYNWSVHKKDGFTWWIWRIKQTLRIADIIRIDHFRAFQDYWEIPYGSKTAINGKWVKGPRMALFNAIKKELGDIPIIAEDLGIIGNDVVQFVKKTGYPGMRVMIFGLLKDEDNIHLPHNWPFNCIGYTSTHDSSTFNASVLDLKDDDYFFALKYLNKKFEKLSTYAIRSAFSSPAKLVIIPIGDLLNLGKEARLNTPGTVSTKNWTWRMQADMLTNDIKEEFSELTETFKRKRHETI